MRYPKKERADRADRTVPIATASRDQTKQSANRAASEKHYARSSSLRDILVERAWASQAINALDSLGESPILNYATKPLQVEIQSLTVRVEPALVRGLAPYAIRRHSDYAFGSLSSR
jgi:hypothetical protein